MARKIIGLCVMALLLMTTACAHNYQSGTTTNNYEEYVYEQPTICEETARQRLLELGWEEEWLDTMVRDGTCLINAYNQTRFEHAIMSLSAGAPFVPSGEMVASQYMGGVYFDDLGILNITVLAGAFDHPASATAIREMREMGIVVYVVEFNQQEIDATIERLNNLWDYAREAGASSWGQGAQNGVIMWLDPYSPEQIATFTQFLQEHNINPDIFIFQPAVTQEMLDVRANRITNAINQPADRITLVGSVDISRTGIAFALENRTEEEFMYGSHWDLAYFHNGAWHPVTHLPGVGGGAWTGEGFLIQSGGIQQYRINFEWHFGELSPGRYMFIRDGWLGEWSPDSPGTYALVEFEITETTPQSLPSEEERELPPLLQVASHSNVTPIGMSIVVENISAYDIDHRAQLIFIVPAEYTTTGYHWEWWEHHLPILPIEGEWEDYFIHGEGFLPAGGTLEFELNWLAVFGELPPGDYKINLSLDGRVHPPHPSGWGGGDGLIAFTVE